MGKLVIESLQKKLKLRKLAKAVYTVLGQKAKIKAELVFESEDGIQILNKRERGVDSVTDVLSFPYLDDIRGRDVKKEDFPDDIDDETDSVLVGSICICKERAKEQAEEYGHSLKREVCYLALHGILHCFGYDHIEKADEEEMTALAEEIMQSLDITR